MKFDRNALVMMSLVSLGCSVDFLSNKGGDQDNDGYRVEDGDCDDVRADVYPGANEVCDDVDNDCDDLIDEQDNSLDWSTALDFYTDADGDGYGDPASSTQACYRSEGLVDNMEDCDDTDALRQPGATEVCDDIDNDCDGAIDDDDDDADLSTTREWYRDLDQDDHGDPSAATEACSAPDGYVEDGTDCDDGDGDIHPDAAELCDEIDNDCDSLIDIVDPDVVDASLWYIDADSDGFGASDTARMDCEPGDFETAVAGDCDDSDSNVFPAATEYCNDIDDDCDGEIDESTAVDASTWFSDADGDGFGDGDARTQACEQPSSYVRDDTDCDDSDPAVFPGAVETCNDIDDDCDGLLDQDDPDAIDQSWFRDSDGDGYGDSDAEVVSCACPYRYVSDDTDCDDTDAEAFPGATWYLDSDRDGYGDGSSSRTSCLSPSGYVSDGTDCDDSDDTEYPGVSWYNDIDGDGYGDATGTANDCEPAYYTDVLDNTDCDDADADIYPGAEEVRGDGIDQDCDGGDVVWVQLSLGDDDAACALDSDGAIYCWGDDHYGEVDDAPTGEGYVQVAMGNNHACAVASDGYVDCWGRDTDDECYAPSLVFEQVSVHDYYSCGLRPSGQIYCWGDNDYGVDETAPSGSFSYLETDYAAACAQYVTGRLMCWYDTSLTVGPAFEDDVPSGLFETFSMGYEAACALDSGGALSCWGRDSDGYVLDGAPSAKYGPFAEVAVGYESACTIDTSGALYCWGYYSSLQTEPAGTFVSLELGSDGGSTFASNYPYACAIDTAGAIECWGNSQSVPSDHP